MKVQLFRLAALALCQAAAVRSHEVPAAVLGLRNAEEAPEVLPYEDEVLLEDLPEEETEAPGEVDYRDVAKEVAEKVAANEEAAKAIARQAQAGGIRGGAYAEGMSVSGKSKKDDKKKKKKKDKKNVSSKSGVTPVNPTAAAPRFDEDEGMSVSGKSKKDDKKKKKKKKDDRSGSAKADKDDRSGSAKAGKKEDKKKTDPANPAPAVPATAAPPRFDEDEGMSVPGKARKTDKKKKKKDDRSGSAKAEKDDRSGSAKAGKKEDKKKTDPADPAPKPAATAAPPRFDEDEGMSVPGKARKTDKKKKKKDDRSGSAKAEKDDRSGSAKAGKKEDKKKTDPANPATAAPPRFDEDEGMSVPGKARKTDKKKKKKDDRSGSAKAEKDERSGSAKAGKKEDKKKMNPLPTVPPAPTPPLDFEADFERPIANE